MKQITVTRNRRNSVGISFPTSIAGETFKSEIRVDRDPESEKLATWDITFETDGTDGELVLTLEAAALTDIVHVSGYMDVKRAEDSTWVQAFDETLEVIFEDPVTA